MNPKYEKWIFYAAVAGGLVAVYQLFGVGKAAVAKLTETGEKVGATLFDWFGPKDKTSYRQYIVTFPDGSRHSVPDTAVDTNGFFTNSGAPPFYAGDGRKYRLAIDRASGAYRAVAV